MTPSVVHSPWRTHHGELLCLPFRAYVSSSRYFSSHLV